MLFRNSVNNNSKGVITTKYLGPTNNKGSRIKATASKGNILTMSYDYALNADENHRKAAKLLSDKMGWNVILADGYVEHLNIGVHIIVGVK